MDTDAIEAIIERYLSRMGIDALPARINALEFGLAAIPGDIADSINAMRERIEMLPPIPVVEIPEVEVPDIDIDIPNPADIIIPPLEVAEDVASDIQSAIDDAIEPIGDAIDAINEQLEEAAEVVTEDIPENIEAALDEPIIETPPARGNAWTRPLFGGGR